MTVRLRDLLLGLRNLRLGHAPVIVHSSLKAFGQVEGGAWTVVQALIAVFDTLIVPTFTYKTMIFPLTGPENNGMTYGSLQDRNQMAEFSTLRTPADPLMGIIPEMLRKHPRTNRSNHPLLSFAGLNAEEILATQTLTDNLAPLGALEKADGWVVLVGVNHTVNTCIHYAEKLAGRRQFIRWSLTPKGVVECPNFPGCSAGFQDIEPDMTKFTRQVQIGDAIVQAVPLKMLFKVVMARINKDPLALLCQEEDCERCGEIRKQQRGNLELGGALPA
jgi:aminoglycoside 3-N-acetyltransferase